MNKTLQRHIDKRELTFIKLSKLKSSPKKSFSIKFARAVTPYVFIEKISSRSSDVLNKISRRKDSERLATAVFG
jgi:hypothetical protein